MGIHASDGAARFLAMPDRPEGSARGKNSCLTFGYSRQSHIFNGK